MLWNCNTVSGSFTALLILDGIIRQDVSELRDDVVMQVIFSRCSSALYVCKNANPIHGEE